MTKVELPTDVLITILGASTNITGTYIKLSLVLKNLDTNIVLNKSQNFVVNY